MRALVLSDSQLDAGRKLADDRLADQEAVLRQVIDLVDDEGIPLVIHGGDVFDSRHPSEEARLVWRRFVRDLTSGGDRSLLVVCGNHELRGTADAAAVDLHDEYYRFVREPAVIEFDGLAVACLPWAPVSHYAARLAGKVNRDEINQRVSELLVDVAAELRDQCDGPCLLVGHWPVSGFSLPNGLPTDQLRCPVLPYAGVHELGFDLACFGDIHVPAREGNVVSVGGLTFNDWGDEGVDHGVWIVDTAALSGDGGSGDSSQRDPRSPEGLGAPMAERQAATFPESARFVPLDDRRFLTVDVDLTEPAHEEEDDETGRIYAALPDDLGSLDGAVLRIRYRATAEQARRIEWPNVERLCSVAGVHRLVQAPDIVQPDRARVAGMTESLSVPEAFEHWLTRTQPFDMDDAFEDRARALAADLLEEVRS